ncbi:MAG: hypothetical protein JRF33_24710 [Deltaproteobacteria bacterium]|nr:hypothetical protein [Deltaproteobacteria bacterium]
MASGSKGSKIFTFVLFSVLLALAYQWQQNRRKEESQNARRGAAREAPQRAKPDGGLGPSRERPEIREKENPGIQFNAARGLQAEKAPHPDFPTAELAGTASLFLLEEPDRGPHVTHVDLPDPRKLRWTLHAVCERAGSTIACGPRFSEKLRHVSHYARGRRGGKLRMVERRKPSGRVDQRWVLDYGPGGRLVQMAELGRKRRVRWVRSFGVSGLDYRSRKLSGANALAGCGSMRLHLDKQRRPIRLDCLQWNGQPMLDALGVASTTFVRDRHGLDVQRRFLGLDEKPTLNRYGVQLQRIERDSAGRELRRLFFGDNDQPILSTDQGCHVLETRWGTDGLEKSETCLGVDGKARLRPQGLSAEEYITDSRGCVVERRNLDQNNKPTADAFGVAKHLVHVDEDCRILRSSCLGLDGQAHACRPSGPAELRYRMDDSGRVVSITHHGKDGGPSGDGEYKVYELRKDWDELDRLIRVRCFGPGDKAVDCSSTGFHAVVKKYDPAGHVIESRFEDAAGKPTKNLGTSRRVFVYDNYDHQVYSHNRDPRGKPVDSLGMTTQRRIYDADHRLFAVLLLDSEGKPAHYRGCFTGAECPKTPWHAVRVVRGEHGGVVKNIFFDAEQQENLELGCAKHRCWE